MSSEGLKPARLTVRLSGVRKCKDVVLGAEAPPELPASPFPFSGVERRRWALLERQLSGATVYTVGHSNIRELEKFLQILSNPDGSFLVDTLIDVRSKPVSRFAPWARHRDLEQDLPAIGITYVWLGAQLGGRPADPSLYDGDQVSYPRLARTADYQAGLAELLKYVAWGRRVVLLCSEEDPAKCHRKLLIAQSLHDMQLGLRVQHVRRAAPSRTAQQPLPAPGGG